MNDGTQMLKVEIVRFLKGNFGIRAIGLESNKKLHVRGTENTCAHEMKLSRILEMLYNKN